MTDAERKDVHAGRLVGTLTGAGALTGLLLVLVFQATQPTILAYKAEMQRQAVYEVLGQPASYETLYLHGDAFTAEPPPEVDPADLERVFLGYDEDGIRMGFAITAAEPGYQDVVKLIFGFDPDRRQVLGMKVLESKETPGLGDKIEKDAGFVSQFEGGMVPLVGLKAGQGEAGDPARIDMITGATISSRTVIRIINNALERLGPSLDRYLKEVRG